MLTLGRAGSPSIDATIERASKHLLFITLLIDLRRSLDYFVLDFAWTNWLVLIIRRHISVELQGRCTMSHRHQLGAMNILGS